MKRPSPLLSLAFLLLLVGRLSPAWGRLILIKGSTTVRRSGGGAIVSTGPNDRAALLFEDGSLIKLNANTTLQIPPTSPAGARASFGTIRLVSSQPAPDDSSPARDGAVPERGVTLDPTDPLLVAAGTVPPLLILRRGEIWQSVTAGRRVTVQAGVDADRGAAARTASDGAVLNLRLAEDGTTTVTVGEGEVEFATRQDRVTVRKSQQSVARPGQAPTRPVAVDVPSIIEWTNDVQPVALLLEVVYVSQDSKRLEAALRETEALPRSPERLLRLGDVRHDRGELQAALEAYQSAVGDRAILEARIAQTRLEIGELPEAEAAFRRSLNLFQSTEHRAPSTEHAILARAGLVMTLLARRESAAALAESRAAVAQDGDSPLAHTILALAQIRIGEREAARRSLERALALDAEYAPAHAWSSFLWRTEERVEEAEAEARRAVALAPFSSLAWQALSDATFARGQVRESRRAAARAVALNPRSAGARVVLGRALVQEGNLAGAARAAEQAVTLDPDRERAQFLHGLVLWEQRRLDRSARALQRAVALDSEFLEARAYLARVYLEQGRRAAAAAVAGEARARDPGFAPVRAAVGRVNWRAGRLEEAAAEYRAALSLAPGSPLYHLEAAQVDLDRNDLPGALSHGLKAVDAVPSSGEAQALLGLIYDRMENREQAQRAYRLALALAPDNALARLGLGAGTGTGSDRLRELRRVVAGQLDGAQLRRRLLQFVDANQNSVDGLREVAQGLLREPDVLARLFEPGVTTEVAPGAGSDDALSFGLTHRGQTALGKLHDLTFGNRVQRDNYRNGRPERREMAWVNLAAAPSYRLHLLGQYFHLGERRPQPGAETNPDPDDRSSFRDNWWDLSTRYQADPRTFLWLHASHRLSANRDDNPDAPLDADLTALTRNRFRQLGLEVRLDHRWGRGDHNVTTYVLSAGRFRLEGLERNYELNRRSFVERLIFGRGQSVSHTVQHELRAGERLSLVAGVSAERYTQGARTGLVGGLPRDVPFPTETRWYPYGQASYLLSPRDRLQLLGHRRRRRPFDFLLPPAEAFFVGEPTALSVGGGASHYEIDYERRFSPYSLARLFLFHEDLDEWFDAPALRQTPDVIGFRFRKARVDGVGLRYERRLGEFLSGYARYTYREAIDVTPRQQQEGRAIRGRQILMNPRSRALLGFNYVDRAGTKLALEANWTGRTEVDRTGQSPPFPSKLVLNLRFGRETSVRHEWVVTLDNLLNTRTIYWPDFPTPGRTFEVQYRFRF